MAVTSLDIQKQNLLKEIDSQELLDKVQKYIRRIKKNTPPCQFSVEELQKQIEQGEKDAEQGLGISQEEMRKRYK